MAKAKQQTATAKAQAGPKKNNNPSVLPTSHAHKAMARTPISHKNQSKNDNHVWSLQQRNVIYTLLSPDQFHMTLKEATRFFNFIFRKELPAGGVTASMLRTDWGKRDKKKGGTKVYRNHICKPKGQFTRAEIQARYDALQQIEDACAPLEADVGNMPFDLGPATDAPKVVPGNSLYRAPRGTVNGKFLPVGWIPTPEDWVEPTAAWTRAEKSLERKVMMQAQTHTRMTLPFRMRTPSMTPAVINGQFQAVHHAPANNGINIANGQSQLASQGGTINNTVNGGSSIAAPAAASAVAAAGANALNILPTIEEELEDYQEDATNEQHEHENESDDTVQPDLADDENNMNDALNEGFDDWTVPELTPAGEDDTQPTAQQDHQALQDLPDEAKAQLQAHIALKDRIFDHIMNLQPYQAIAFFQAAFPELSRDALAQLDLTSHDRIERTWWRTVTESRNQPMFELIEALSHVDSPLSPTYTPRLRMFHSVNVTYDDQLGYLTPEYYRAILPSNPLYKNGGPVVRTWEGVAGRFQDIMTCNTAFCNVCGSPPTFDPTLHLENMPFVHFSSLSVHQRPDQNNNLEANITDILHFEGDGHGIVGGVPNDHERLPHIVEFADGVSRLVWSCNVVECG